MSLYASCVFKCLQRLEGVRPPGTGVPDGFELLDVGARTKWVSAALLTAQLSL